MARLKLAGERLGLTIASLGEFDVPADRTLKQLCFAA
jgi:hypothetical protein